MTQPHPAAPASAGLVERLRAYAAEADRVALVTPGAARNRLSYAELWEESGRCAAALLARGVGRGDRVAVSMTSRWETVAALVALQRLGCALVPLQDAAPRPDDARGASVLAALRAGGARWCIVAEPAVEAHRAALAADALGAEVLALEPLFAGRDGDVHLPADAGLAPGDLMLIQFSSGSTAQPKGVCLTRANIEANVAAITERLRGGPREVTVSWLPLYHDMGLIGALFTSLWAGATLVLLRPSDFVRNPLSWIEALARYRATMTMGPQFAYSLCVARSRGAAAWERLRELDLSSLKVAMNGSETVNWELSRRFSERFAPLGLSPFALQPAYGLAENCVAVTIRDPGTPVPVRRLSRAALGRGRLELLGDGGAEGDVQVAVGTGAPVSGTRVSIRTGDGGEGAAGEVGQIHVAGASATVALCLGDGTLRAADEGGWVPTGDIGALLDGELYVIGRIKEIIKCGGRTFVPSDIEATLTEQLRDEVGGVAVFGVYDEGAGGEEVVVVAEAPRGARGGGEALPEQVRLCVLQRFALPVREVVVVRGRAIPRTSSGKIQRVQLQQAYLHGGPAALAGA